MEMVGRQREGGDRGRGEREMGRERNKRMEKRVGGEKRGFFFFSSF